VVLLAVAGFAAVSALAAAWARSQIRDERTWAATAEALADDPEVREAVADVFASQVMALTGADDVLSGILPGPLDRLADPLTSTATDLVRSAAYELVGTDAFRATWEAAVRSSHAELISALDGDGRFTVIGNQGLYLDLGSTLGQFRDLLDERGVTVLDRVDLSGIDVRFLLIDAPGIHRLRDVLEVLDVLVVVLPVVAVTAAVVGLVVARRRSWGVIAAGLGGVAAAAAIWLVVELGRDRATEEMSGGALGAATARVVTDRVVSSVEDVLVASLVVAGIVVVAGVASAALSARRA